MHANERTIGQSWLYVIWLGIWHRLKNVYVETDAGRNGRIFPKCSFSFELSFKLSELYRIKDSANINKHLFFYHFDSLFLWYKPGDVARNLTLKQGSGENEFKYAAPIKVDC